LTPRQFIDKYKTSVRSQKTPVLAGSVFRDEVLYAQMYGVTHTIYAKEDIYKDVFNLDPAAIERTALEIMEYYLKSGHKAPSKGLEIT
jgi:hypothetical protein